MIEYAMAAVVILAYIIAFLYSKEDKVTSTSSDIVEKTPRGEVHAKDPEKTFYGL